MPYRGECALLSEPDDIAAILLSSKRCVSSAPVDIFDFEAPSLDQLCFITCMQLKTKPSDKNHSQHTRRKKESADIGTEKQKNSSADVGRRRGVESSGS